MRFDFLLRAGNSVVSARQYGGSFVGFFYGQWRNRAAPQAQLYIAPASI
jgi:hypothetical protein